MTISRNSNIFLMGIDGSLSQKGIIKFQFNRRRFIKLFPYNNDSDRIKRIRINLLMKREIHAATVRAAFP